MHSHLISQPSLISVYCQLSAAFASNKTSTGCNLKKTKAIRKHMDPEAEPLETNITIIINCVRDVPDSGGSLATDFA